MTHQDLAKWGERAWVRFVRILPLRAYTRAMRVVGGVPLPVPLREPVYGWVAKMMGIDLSEAELPIGGYRTFTELFVRRLKPDARPVDRAGDTLACPVDGVLTTVGQVQRGTVVQAKGIDYSLEELLGEADLARAFEGGSFFTLYLRPRDYHRIHCPVTAQLLRWRRLGGRLLPVKPFMVRNVADLLAQNERLWFLLESGLGQVLVVCVAAAGVGTITATNQVPGSAVEKGEEIAAFNVGSTVIVFVAPGSLRPAPLALGSEVRVGQVLARCRQAAGAEGSAG